MIKGVAASYDVGGIIGQDQIAQIHAGETILPKGITADMKSAGLMIQPLGRNSATSPTMYGIINLDGREIAGRFLSTLIQMWGWHTQDENIYKRY